MLKNRYGKKLFSFKPTKESYDKLYDENDWFSFDMIEDFQKSLKY